MYTVFGIRAVEASAVAAMKLHATHRERESKSGHTGSARSGSCSREGLSGTPDGALQLLDGGHLQSGESQARVLLAHICP